MTYCWLYLIIWCVKSPQNIIILTILHFCSRLPWSLNKLCISLLQIIVYWWYSLSTHTKKVILLLYDIHLQSDLSQAIIKSNILLANFCEWFCVQFKTQCKLKPHWQLSQFEAHLKFTSNNKAQLLHFLSSASCAVFIE